MISHNRSQRGLQGTLGSVLTYLFSSYVYAQMDIQSHAGTFFDDCRYRCVMMSYGREQGRGGMIKGTREGMKRQKRISKTNNGTKMATASTTGRATALRPPDHLQEPFSSPGRLVHGCHSNKLVMTYWNHQVILSRPRRHRQRRANMVRSYAFFRRSHSPPPLLNHQTSMPVVCLHCKIQCFFFLLCMFFLHSL